MRRRTRRYTSKEKIAEKNPSKINKKTMALLFAGAISIVGYFGGYDKVKDEYTNADNLKSNIEEKVDIQSTTEPEFSRFYNENREKFDEIKSILTKYQTLTNKEERTDKDEKELDYLVECINVDYAGDIRKLALDAIKSKVADANKIKNYESIKINPNFIEKGYYDSVNIIDTNQNTILHKIEKEGNKSELADAIFLLMENQQNDPEMSWDKTKYANNLYKLYNSTIKVSNKQYMKGENGKGENGLEIKDLIEIGTENVKEESEKGEER